MSGAGRSRAGPSPAARLAHGWGGATGIPTCAQMSGRVLTRVQRAHSADAARSRSGSLALPQFSSTALGA